MRREFLSSVNRSSLTGLTPSNTLEYLTEGPLKSMGHAVFVFGAAGAGKSTFCKSLRERSGPQRQLKLVNLDPAQENGAEYDVDLCDFITVGEVMESCDFGPNGALFCALQEMCSNIDELHLYELEDEYFFFDCPGQIELFLHSDVIDQCIKHVQQFAKVAVVYLTDATSFTTSDKHLYSSLCATITAGRLHVPVINILTKCDLVSEEELESILNGPVVEYDGSEYGRLRNTIREYVEYNGFMDYLPLDWNKDEAVENAFLILDNILQRYDDVEPVEVKDE